MNNRIVNTKMRLVPLLGAMSLGLTLAGCGSADTTLSEESAKKVYLAQGLIKTSPLDNFEVKKLPIKLVSFRKTEQEERQEGGEKYRLVGFEAEFEWSADYNNPDERNIYEKATGFQRFGGRKGERLAVEGGVAYIFKDQEWRLLVAFSKPAAKR